MINFTKFFCKNLVWKIKHSFSLKKIFSWNQFISDFFVKTLFSWIVCQKELCLTKISVLSIPFVKNEKFRQINSWVISLVKTLLSRIFCQFPHCAFSIFFLFQWFKVHCNPKELYLLVVVMVRESRNDLWYVIVQFVENMPTASRMYFVANVSLKGSIVYFHYNVPHGSLDLYCTTMKTSLKKKILLNSWLCNCIMFA